MNKPTASSITAIALAFAALSGTANAGVTVKVTVIGTVGFNQIGAPPLGLANGGDPATLTFLLDSDLFTNSVSFPTRGYHIDQTSFTLTVGAATVGLQSPFPAGETPYFVLRDNDPAVDGFFTATSVDFPIAVPLSQTGIFTQFKNNYSVTYGGSTLSSLNILGALGTYNFAGLSVFNWTIDDASFNAMDINFAGMKIEACPLITTYCTAGTSASGCQASISATGTPSATAASGFDLIASDVEGSKSGLFYFGANGRQANSWGNGSSFQCVAPPVSRATLISGGGTNGACNGSFSEDLNALWCPGCPKPGKNPGVGAVVQGQLWYRDPQNTSSMTTSLSNAVEFTLCP
jgi:hypothetical protein